MRRSHIAVLIGLILAFAVSAEPPPLTITDAGYFLTVVGDDDVPTYVEIEDVFDLRTGTPDPNPPKGDPPREPDPPPPGISADVAEWAAEISDPEGAQKYAIIFETVRDGAIEKKVDTDSLFNVLRQSADEIIDENWESFRRKVSDQFTDLLQRGELSTQQQIVETMELIRHGLHYSARNADSIDNADGLSIVVKVNAIIDGVQK